MVALVEGDAAVADDEVSDDDESVDELVVSVEDELLAVSFEVSVEVSVEVSAAEELVPDVDPVA